MKQLLACHSSAFHGGIFGVVALRTRLKVWRQPSWLPVRRLPAADFANSPDSSRGWKLLYWQARKPAATRIAGMLRFFRGALSVFAISSGLAQEEFNPRALSVEVSASVQETPPTITLRWPGDSFATSYELSRKSRADQSWTALATLPGDVNTYADSNVAVGAAYEYQIIKRTNSKAPPYAGYGHIYAGMNVPIIESRGTVILIVDNRWSGELGAELDRLRQDLIGDGWNVIRHDVSPNDSPEAVKALIKTDYTADPQNVKAVFLFGHVAVPYSGDIQPDGHDNHQGAWPADGYYGEMHGEWTDSSVNRQTAERKINWNVPGDGKFDQSTFPSDVDLQVGRVDFWNMTSFMIIQPSRSEKNLLRQYLNKDHNFRHGLLKVDRRGIVCDNFGMRGDDSVAGSGWRNLAAFFGAENVIEVGFGQYLPTVTSQSFLWAYGAGGGSYYYSSGVANAEDFAIHDPKVVFTMFLGSYYGDWNNESAFLRSPLGSTTYTLTCSYSGFPHWYYQHMALGETIGDGVLLSQNNKPNGVYLPQAQQGAHEVHIALMGDPTLRLHPVIPPADLVASAGADAVQLNWSASGDSEILGYHVYRAASEGPFARITGDSPVAGTNFTDHPPGGTFTYMVRAVKVERSASGTYFNPSQGIVTTVETIGGNQQKPPAAPTGLAATATSPTQVRLTWSNATADQTGVKVERRLAARGEFAELAILAGSVTTYEDNSCVPGARYLYRVRAFNDVGESPYSSAADVTTFSQLPELLRISRGEFAGNTFKLWIEGKPGQEVGLQATDDFSQWQTLFTRTLDSSTIQLVDDSIRGVNQRVYRLQLLQ